MEVMVNNKLEKIGNKVGVDLKIITANSFNLSSACGFFPDNKVILRLSYPGITVAAKEEPGITSIYLDPCSLTETNNIDDVSDSTTFQITHELSHASIAKMGWRDLVHYTFFKGRYVDNSSDEEFRHINQNLMENVDVDSLLCKNDFLRKTFFKFNNPEIDLLNYNLSFLYRLRRKNKMFLFNYDTYLMITRILYISSIARFLKDNPFVNGYERSLATKFGSLFHRSLKGAIGDDLINNRLMGAYNELTRIAENSPYSKKHILKNLDYIWNLREDLNKRVS